MKTLKYKNKVSEIEFFDYLNGICDNEYIKKMILDFYSTLKTIDNKFGKQLTIKSFGKMPGGMEYPIYTDQAKYLFLSKEDQAKDDDFLNQFETALYENKKIKDEDLRTDANKKAYKILQKGQDELYNQEAQPIGASDLFRFQFMNLIDEIEVTSEKYTNKNVLGAFYITKQKIALFDVSQDGDKFKQFRQQNNTCHEFTHMLSTKTAQDGQIRFLRPWYVIDKDVEFIVWDTPFDGVLVNDALKNAYFYGGLIISEVATDFYSVFCPGRLGWGTINFEDATDSPKNFSIFMNEFKEGNFSDHTTYAMFAHMFEIVFGNKNNFRKCIINPAMPVWGQYNITRNFLRSANISPELDEKINKHLAQTFDCDRELFDKPNIQFEKFMLLFGQGYYTYFKKQKPTPFNEDIMLAQSMLLDIMQSKLHDNLASDVYNPSSPEFSEQNLNAYLNNLSMQAKYIDNWVIKPNITLAQDKNKFARDFYCNGKLAEMAPQNPAIQTWAQYLKMLCTCTHNLAPGILKNSQLLKSEYDYLKKTKNNELAVEK